MALVIPWLLEPNSIGRRDPSGACPRMPCGALQRTARPASIRFNLINPQTGNRIRMITQNAENGKELERRDLVKGYELRRYQHLMLKDEASRSRAPR